MCFQVPVSILWQLFELWVSTMYSGIKNLARSMCGIAGSQPKFYDTIQSHGMIQNIFMGNNGGCQWCSFSNSHQVARYQQFKQAESISPVT